MNLILIDSEFRSLIRSTLEKVIGSKFNKKYSKTMGIILKLSIRVVSSLIAIQLYKELQKYEYIKQIASYLGVFGFILFLISE